MAVINKTSLALRLFGDDLDPTEISALLGAWPTFWRRKGDVRTLSSGREIVARKGSWLLDVKDRSPGDLNGQLQELFAMVTADLSVWRGLTQLFLCDVSCGLFMQESNEGEELSRETVRLLADRGLALSLDIYDPVRDRGSEGSADPV